MKHYNRRPQRSKEWGRKPKKPSGPPPFDVLMRRFKKKCERSGVVAEVRERQYYEKPNQKKHKKNQEITRRRKLDAKRAALAESRRKWFN